MICKIPECGKKEFKLGWCEGHHGRYVWYGNPLGGSKWSLAVPDGERLEDLVQWARTIIVEYGEMFPA